MTHRVVERHVEEDAVDEIVLGAVDRADRGEHRVHKVRVDHLLSHCARARGALAPSPDPRDERSLLVSNEVVIG